MTYKTFSVDIDSDGIALVTIDLPGATMNVWNGDLITEFGAWVDDFTTNEAIKGGYFHTGDIGNVKLDAKGKGTFTITTDLWTLGGSFNKNIVGKAIIVHSGVDDFTTQPTGNAGNRIGCGLIVAK